MNGYFVLLIACLATVGHGLPTQIVGGTDAEIGKYPYMVSLRNNNKHFCGGSIINVRYILTAAHCLTGFKTNADVADMTVHAGTNFLNQSGDVYNAEAVIIHEKFNIVLIRNDIGLVRLKTDIKYNEIVKPIDLASTNSVEDGHPCLLTGWGTLEFMGKVPNELQKLDLKVYSQTKCKRTFVNLKNSHICAFSQYGEGACHGDSGSPLVADGVQIGIASFVRPCAIGYPDAYTRVYSYKNWVSQNVVL
ncbi:chymotrypsin-2-like [Pseudomyrmex gracilis]|nr:chymotrypsin-2-like [Pseudomyrmex gracilis]